MFSCLLCANIEKIKRRVQGVQNQIKTNCFNFAWWIITPCRKEVIFKGSKCWNQQPFKSRKTMLGLNGWCTWNPPIHYRRVGWSWLTTFKEAWVSTFLLRSSFFFLTKNIEFFKDSTGKFSNDAKDVYFCPPSKRSRYPRAQLGSDINVDMYIFVWGHAN